MELQEFIVLAKKNTYANDNSKKEKLSDGSTRILFSKDNFSYEDKYYALNNSSEGFVFSGTEKVFYKNKLIWLMCYTGKILSNIISHKKIYSFLRKSLSLINNNYPFRGPKNNKQNNFEYNNEQEGDINFFNGVETIKYKGEIVYKLYYNGGLIQ